METETVKKSFRSIEDMVAWKKATEFALEVYSLSNKDLFSKDYSLKDQVRRSAVSIPSNIAEGYGRGGTKEFIQFLSIAKGSLFELKTQLYIASELKYLDKAKLGELNNTMDDLGKIISGLINYLKNTEVKGSKYKSQSSKN